MTEQWKGAIVLAIYKKANKTGNSNYRAISHLSTAYSILSNILLSKITTYTEKIIGLISGDFDKSCQLLIICCAFSSTQRSGSTTKQCVRKLYISSKFMIPLGERGRWSCLPLATNFASASLC
jgi:hypothetical protein